MLPLDDIQGNESTHGWGEKITKCFFATLYTASQYLYSWRLFSLCFFFSSYLLAAATAATSSSSLRMSGTGPKGVMEKGLICLWLLV